MITISPVRIGLWIPPDLQGNALKIEQNKKFKRCVEAEIRACVDLPEDPDVDSLMIEPPPKSRKGGTRDNYDVEYEIYAHVLRYLNQHTIEHEIGVHAHAMSAFCVPDGDDEPWIKSRVYPLYWPLDDDGLRNWTTDDAVKRFEKDRGRRITGNRLRSRMCNIPLMAFVQTEIPFRDKKSNKKKPR